jgi:hypothetical protein
MASMTTGDLGVLIRSRVPILAIECDDEDEVLKSILRASGCSSDPAEQGVVLAPGRPKTGLPVFKWTVTDGLKRLDLAIPTAPQRTATQPEEILKHVRASNVAGTYVLLDFHPYLTDPLIVRLLKDIAHEYSSCARTLVLVSGQLTVPRELESLAARCTLAVPGRDERRRIVEQIAHEWVQTHPSEPV